LKIFVENPKKSKFFIFSIFCIQKHKQSEEKCEKNIWKKAFWKRKRIDKNKYVRKALKIKI